jgi:hypothetical protein
MKKLFLLLTIVNFTLFSFATSYTWTGSSSTNWATSSNWSPSGVPSTGDKVTISSTTRQPLLDASRTILCLTITTDTLDLNGYTLTIGSGAGSTFTSGFINNGTLKFSSTTSATFEGTEFGAVITGSCLAIQLNGGVFNSAVTLTKLGNTNDVGKGGCLFNDAVTLHDSAT